jgi:non-homologous end joining protein Ku
MSGLKLIKVLKTYIDGMETKIDNDDFKDGYSQACDEIIRLLNTLEPLAQEVLETEDVN